jgi:hypothetical protein
LFGPPAAERGRSLDNEVRRKEGAKLPKLRCRCGYVHDVSPVPDAGWLTVRDREYEELLAAEAERGRLGAAGMPAPEFAAADRRLGELHGLLYECPECGRLMWRPPGETEFRTYRPEPPASERAVGADERCIVRGGFAAVLSNALAAQLRALGSHTHPHAPRR